MAYEIETGDYSQHSVSGVHIEKLREEYDLSKEERVIYDALRKQFEVNPEAIYHPFLEYKEEKEREKAIYDSIAAQYDITPEAVKDIIYRAYLRRNHV